jgi:hypothetical protein
MSIGRFLAGDLWGRLDTFAVPSFTFRKRTVPHRTDELALALAELSVFTAGCFRAAKRESDAMFTTTREELTAQTGYEEAQIGRALQGLVSKKFLHRVDDKQTRTSGQFDAENNYIIADPITGQSFARGAPKGKKPRNLRSILFQSDVKYLTMPTCVGRMLAPLKGSSLALYMAALQVASKRQRNQFNIDVAELRLLAGIGDNRTVFKIVEEVLYPFDGQRKNYLEMHFSSNRRTVEIELLDPDTDLTIEDRQMELDLQVVQQPKIDARTHEERIKRGEQLLRFVKTAIAAPIIIDDARAGEYKTTCPFCYGDPKRRHVPTFTLNTSPAHGFGMYQCYQCRVGHGQGKNLLSLVMDLKGLTKFQALVLLDRCR